MVKNNYNRNLVATFNNDTGVLEIVHNGAPVTEEDWQTEIDQIFREEAYVIERASDISKATGIPVETVLTRFGYAAKAPPPRPEGKDGSSEKPDGKAKPKKEEEA